METKTKTKIVIHCADTYAHMNVGAAEIRSWHLARGWSDIGYHYVIKRNGTLETGRDRDNDGKILEETGAHVYGHNTGTLGICLIGGKGAHNGPEDNFTVDQWTTLRTLVLLLSEVYPKAKIFGHTELDKGKSCPNFDVQKWLVKISL